MLGAATAVAFIATRDLDRARRYYVDLLGLSLVGQDEYACVAAAGNVQIRIAHVPHHEPASYTVLGWVVPDITQTVGALTDAGVGFTRYPELDQDDHAVWASPSGARVAWFADPDGNVLSVTQLA